ncbi:hypothetical protein A8924_0216 [Saccharopolyspora erythraea NRRL 2338]|uniref:Uncharacterized protein n=1 Tax=Saccharopolyspora erythraea (strain ATCC 11635 / DSM 40517 / JCM 4748 / NBRC 13426 / NCIMB 8594 / NRRL 2338) TaxID=405948 RepID=A4FQR4_SACEN|nr:hypothetical protein N599_02880 [Saccharopolyspora erythraea D]PFG92991.1 hypothetical protein A8924_0216 [Saccharopolyspora erythraea NRRL 2338]CAM06389.1 hypothetical protein SACE_7231 [Saccharopolyspora erythraea NRRL 2338]
MDALAILLPAVVAGLAFALDGTLLVTWWRGNLDRPTTH